MILRSVEKLCEIFVLQCMCCESTFSDNIRKVPWIWKVGLHQSSRGSPHVREVLIQNLFFQPLLRRWLPISFPRCLEQRSATSISRYQLSNPKERSPDQVPPSLSWPGVWRTMSCPSSWTFWELLRRSATIWTSTMGRRLPTVWELFETLVQVGYKTILHLAIDEDDFDATPFVEACLKVGWDWMGWDMLRLR